MNSVNSPRDRAIALLIFATLLWGSTFSFTKVLVATLPPMYLLGWRFLITILIIGCIYPRHVSRELWRGLTDPWLLLFSAVNIGAISTQTVGIQTTTASNAGFITAFSVILVPILKHFHFKVPISKAIIVAVGIALMGLYLISFGFSLPNDIHQGDIWIFACSLFYGYYIILIEMLVKRFSGATTMFISFGLTSIACFLIALFVEVAPPLSVLLSGPVVWNMLGLATLGGVVAYLLMAYGQRHVPAEVAGLIYTLEPLFALLIAWIFLGERMTGVQLTGAGFILMALVIGIREQRT